MVNLRLFSAQNYEMGLIFKYMFKKKIYFKIPRILDLQKFIYIFAYDFANVEMKPEVLFYNIFMYLYNKNNFDMLKLLEVDLNLCLLILKVALLCSKGVANSISVPCTPTLLQIISTTKFLELMCITLGFQRNLFIEDQCVQQKLVVCLGELLLRVRWPFSWPTSNSTCWPHSRPRFLPPL